MPTTERDGERGRIYERLKLLREDPVAFVFKYVGADIGDNAVRKVCGWIGANPEDAGGRNIALIMLALVAAGPSEAPRKAGRPKGPPAWLIPAMKTIMELYPEKLPPGGINQVVRRLQKEPYKTKLGVPGEPRLKDILESI